MQTDQTVITVKFFPCGAENHPAFSGATLSHNPNGFSYYTLEFPIGIKGINKSAHAQKAWADEKVKHLRSWGTEGIIRYK